MSAIAVAEVAEPYIRRRAIRHLEKGRVVIFAAGTGNPFFTTDTAAALRALEIGAEAILMAKNGVEGVYDGDPQQRPEAPSSCPSSPISRRSSEGLKVMDTTALSLCMDNGLPIYVFELAEGNIERVVAGERVGTIISTRGGPDARRRSARRTPLSAWTSRSRRPSTEFNTVRTGRASTALLDRITVDYYGTRDAAQQLATITSPEPRMLTVQPFDPSSLKAIEKAIMESDLGLTPSNDGKRHPPADPAADRGAPQGARQGSSGTSPRRAGRRPQRSPRRDAPPEGARPATARSATTTSAAPRSSAQKLTDEHIKTIDELLKRQRSRDHGGLTAATGLFTDARPHVRDCELLRAISVARRERSCRRPRARSPSSWTATAAGRRRRGLPVAAGHRAGTRALRRTVEAASTWASRRSPSTPSRPRTGRARRTRSTR